MKSLIQMLSYAVVILISLPFFQLGNASFEWSDNESFFDHNEEYPNLSNDFRKGNGEMEGLIRIHMGNPNMDGKRSTEGSILNLQSDLCTPNGNGIYGEISSNQVNLFFKYELEVDTQKTEKKLKDALQDVQEAMARMFVHKFSPTCQKREYLRASLATKKSLHQKQEVPDLTGLLPSSFVQFTKTCRSQRREADSQCVSVDNNYAMYFPEDTFNFDNMKDNFFMSIESNIKEIVNELSRKESFEITLVKFDTGSIQDDKKVERQAQAVTETGEDQGNNFGSTIGETKIESELQTEDFNEVPKPISKGMGTEAKGFIIIGSIGGVFIIVLLLIKGDRNYNKKDTDSEKNTTREEEEEDSDDDLEKESDM